jgi:hypothetical protein
MANKKTKIYHRDDSFRVVPTPLFIVEAESVLTTASGSIWRSDVNETMTKPSH